MPPRVAAGAVAGSRLPPASIPQLVRSDSSASNSSSSTDTSEEEERQRQEALGDAAPSVAGPIGAALGILLLLLLIQSSGAWLFTKGFLLTRATLDGHSTCSGESVRDQWTPPLPPPSGDVREWQAIMHEQAECTLPPSHNRALLFIIDALRYDFIAPPPASFDKTWKPSPFYHDILRTPHLLHAQVSSSNPNKGKSQQQHLSFLSHFMADAPTTTLQRLKALTTGTLPTFIDAGSNFAGSEIDEDSWLAQLRRAASKQPPRLGFMGDDTWTTVFPRAFDANWTWPYDSFNVEDLDSVDAGVTARLLPFLERGTNDRPEGAEEWKLLVAHSLGVDHVGHRFGAAHSALQTKLHQMETLVKRIVDALPDDALFVLMGDHGMDQHGDHGGDGELEVGAGLWVYSKALLNASQDGGIAAAYADEVKSVLQFTAKASVGHSEGSVRSHVPFSPLPSPPYAHVGHRSVTQIDLVPSLSLLLGIAIPFNNLGTVIPELFPPTKASPDRLLRATRINARQIHTYLRAYAARSRDLEPFAEELERTWETALLADLKYVRALENAGKDALASQDEAIEVLEARIAATIEYTIFTRTALLRARSVWAQFELAKMVVGLAILTLSLASIWQLRQATLSGMHVRWETRQDATPRVRGAGLRIRTRRLPVRTETLQETMRFAWRRASLGAGAASAVTLSAWLLKTLSPEWLSYLAGLSFVDLLLTGSGIGAQLGLLHSQASRWSLASPSLSTLVALALILAHGAGFGSVYFVIWEDFFVLLLVLLPLLVRAAHGYMYAPTPKLRRRIVVLALGCAAALRLAAFSRVCREEQALSCRASFYDSSLGASLNSPYALGSAYVVALLLPQVLGVVLAQSKSNVGVAPVFLRWIATPALLMGAGYWLVDWAAPSANLSSGAKATLEWLKLAVARADLALICIVGTAFWTFSPLCLELKTEEIEGPKAVGAPPPPGKSGQEPAQPAQQQKHVIVIGFANSLGSSYLLGLTLMFALLFLLAQPMGQLVLSVGLFAILALAELGDTERDAALLRARFLEDAKAKKGRGTRSKDDDTPAPGSLAAAAAAAASAGVGGAAAGNGPPTVVPPTLLEVTTLALLGSLLFFATGHQATFPSIQWRVAFVGLRSVTYPFSPLFVILNTFGPLALLPALAAPLLVLWNLAPRPRAAPNSPEAQKARQKMRTITHVLATNLALLLYFAIVALAAAFFAAWFKRHLMLFKLWTPRFMTSLAALATAHVGSALGVIMVGVVAGKVATTFGSTFE